MPLILALVLTVLVAAVTAPFAPAEAGGVKIIIGGGHPHPGLRPPAHRRHRVVGPRPIFVRPSHCWVPGSWAYYFVPQYRTYNVWVEGHWSPGGTWIGGHYEPRVHGAGYYQPYWVEGRWVLC